MGLELLGEGLLQLEAAVEDRNLRGAQEVVVQMASILVSFVASLMVAMQREDEGRTH